MRTPSISGRVRGAHPASFAVAVGVVVLVAVNAWWLLARRSGMPLYLDEGGYLATSMDWLHQLQGGGLAALGQAIELEQLQAPLTMLLTMPLQAMAGGSVEIGFVAILLAYGVVLALTYAVARRLAEPWPAAIATLALAVAPETSTSPAFTSLPCPPRRSSFSGSTSTSDPKARPSRGGSSAPAPPWASVS